MTQVFSRTRRYILTAGRGCDAPRSLSCYRFRHNVHFRRILPGPAHARERRLAQEIAALRLDAENRPKCPKADLASGSWVEIVHRRTRAKRFRIRSEAAPYGALRRSLWESTCGRIIEAAATSASS